MQSQMPLVAAREFNAPIEPAALGQPARSEGMRLCPRSSPSREGSSYSGSRAVQWRHRTRTAMPKWVLPLNSAAHADARTSACFAKVAGRAPVAADVRRVRADVDRSLRIRLERLSE